MSESPYQIDGPAVISFSGGRTSGYMLRKILDAYNGTLPLDVRVVFANTGKEREETLTFIHECETRWNVEVHWIEYDPITLEQDHHPTHFIVRKVSYETASRNGEPFDRLLTKLGFLPNVAMRSCTHYLKQKTIDRYITTVFGFDDWKAIIGIRADEPRRVAKMKAQNEKEVERVLPLDDAGVTVADVMAYWENQPFDLRLRPDQGNCDGCFLKSQWKVLTFVREEPEKARWWADWEQKTGKVFRLDRPDYASMLAQPDLFEHGETNDLIECFCHD